MKCTGYLNCVSTKNRLVKIHFVEAKPRYSDSVDKCTYIFLLVNCAEEIT